MAQENPPPPQPSDPRFTLELEFVLSLANPHYLSHLAATYPNLLGISSSSTSGSASSTRLGKDKDNPSASPDAQAFAAYLAYLYDYWKRPEYVQFLTHPGATLRTLRLLQEESFRTAVIRPQVIEALLGSSQEGDESAIQKEPEKEQQGAKADTERKNETGT